MQFNVTPDQHVGLCHVIEWTATWTTQEVTVNVCINNRMFVSGKRSKVIYDLDMEKNDHRSLEHDYLNGIISMDVHGTTHQHRRGSLLHQSQ